MAFTPAAPRTAKVKRYSCLYTDQVKKKHKSFKDGYIRHHHFNNRLFLLSAAQNELSSTFYKPHPPQPQPLNDSYTIEEGEEIEFDGFIAQVESIEFETVTDVTNLRDKAKKPEEALAWGKSVDEFGTPARPSPSTSHSHSSSSSSRPTSGVILNEIIGARPAYKGFGIPPPANYTPGGTPASRKKTKGSPPPAYPKPLPVGGRPTTSATAGASHTHSTPSGPQRSYSTQQSSTPGPVVHSNQRFPKGHPNYVPLGYSPYSKPASPAPSSFASRQSASMSTPARAATGPIRTAGGTPRAAEDSGREFGALRDELKVRELDGVSTPSRGALKPFKMPRPGGGAGASGTPSRLGRG